MNVYYILAAAFILLLAHYTYTLQMSVRKMPPGPLVLPIIGSWFSIWLRKPTLFIRQVRPWEYFDMVSKEFGDLFSISHAGLDAVVIASYELLEEVSYQDEYSAKFAHELITYPRTFGKEMGILFANSKPLWKEMRKFTVKTLREFGFGKNCSMHSVISDEAALLINDLKITIKSAGGTIQFCNLFSLPVLNILWCMVAGTRYAHDDPRIQDLLHCIFKLSKSRTFIDPLLVLIPLINTVLPKYLQLSSASRHNVYDDIHRLSKNIINTRKAEGYYLNNPQNYIDVFLKKIQDNQMDRNSSYTEQQLQSMIADLLFVGTLTTSSTLSYAVLFLVLHPAVQKKCQEEIDTVIGRHMPPSLDDVAKMPYFQAFLLEVHRCSCVLPNPIPRVVPRNWPLRGFVIPKGTVIISNHFSINRDDKIWGDAKTFRPDRFINDKGVFISDPRVVVFGFGKRICIGAHLVNTIFPLFMATLLQTFEFSIPQGSKPPTTEPDIGINLSPQTFSAQVNLRLN